MSASHWDCCRACLKSENLFPIFANQLFNDKYINVIEKSTGLQVEPTDSLPQEMCSECIAFINEIVKFRRKCEESNKYLLSKVNNDASNVKLESTQPAIKLERDKPTEIDISHLISDYEDHFTDHDDHIPLGTLYTNGLDSVDTNKTEIQTEHINITYTKGEIKKKVKRKVREKKENKTQRKEQTQRVKEEIECEYCHKVLTSRLSLRNHYKIHTGFDFVCEHCGKKFITRRLLLMHCRAKHGYEKTDKCSYCDYKGSNAEQVKIHERLHTGERPYVCAHCSAGFHRKSSYLTHVATHLPEKTVQCDQCPARFKSVTLMRIHKSRHRGPSYTFRCRICDNTFARRRNVVRHLQRIHGLSPEQEHMERIKTV